MKLHAKLLLLTMFCVTHTVTASQWQATSGSHHTAVLELFTSEGCGNCPPAERWLHQQKLEHAELDFIVLALHVDYLNEKKGWVDRFASQKFSERQKQLARLNLYQTVYTPEFVLSGESLPNWREHFTEAVRFLNDFEAQAKLIVKVYQKSDTLMVNIKSNVSGQENRRHSKLYLALTEDDVSSRIAGGDNAGQTLIHQNLVREWSGPIELDASGESFTEHQINLSPEWQQDNLKLVAFIQNLSDGYILQAIDLPLTKQN